MILFQLINAQTGAFVASAVNVDFKKQTADKITIYYGRL